MKSFNKITIKFDGLDPDYKMLPTRNLRFLRNPFQKSGTFTSEPSFTTRRDDTISLKASEIFQKLRQRHRAPSNQQLPLQKLEDNSNVPQCCGTNNWQSA